MNSASATPYDGHENMGDTPEHIEQMQYDMIMSRTPAERMAMASSMFESCRRLVAAGIQCDGKPRTPAELRVEVFRRIYADDFAPEEMDVIVREMLRRASDTGSNESR